MKKIGLTALVHAVIFSGIALGSEFDVNAVKAIEGQISQQLNTSQTRIDWSNAQDPVIKGQKYDLLLNEIAGEIFARQWTYPAGAPWPLIDWTKVASLNGLLDDQAKVLEETQIAAQSDEEMAKLSTASWSAIGQGKEMEPWFEDWILGVAKGTNTNLKRLLFLTLAGVGEDMLKASETIRAIDWNKWELAFNDSDEFGKAMLLVCMTDLASRSDQFADVAEIHVSVFDGADDDLKAVALYSGNKKLGASVTAKWQNIADNHSNAKLKALATEALSR